MKNIFRYVLVYLALLAVAYVAVVTHAVIASGYTDALIGQRVSEPFDLTIFGAIAERSHRYEYWYVEIQGNGGAYNGVLKRMPDGAFYFDFDSTIRQSVDNALIMGEQFGVPSPIPFPFVIPLVVHVVLVGVVRLFIAFCKRGAKLYWFRPLVTHALVSSLYAFLVVMWFQLSRMIWANERWGPGAYLNDSQAGRLCLYILFGLSVVIYFYCVLGTAGLQVRRKPTAKKQTCIRCGYWIEGEGKCAECGLEVGAFIDSKFRVNHLYLGGMMVVTFFSPVLVASVYSIVS